ncbi:MAG: hypothetical protein AAF485_13860, partial [Chloroflexota bacterium]
KQDYVSIFEIFDAQPEEEIALKLETKGDFEMGVQCYYAERHAEAGEYFNRVWNKNPNDEAAHLYLRRTNQLLEYGVPVDWDEVDVLIQPSPQFRKRGNHTKNSKPQCINCN